ncbi:MAG TPA: hypothetical protein VIT65_27400 [Microlunatus sp.]
MPLRSQVLPGHSDQFIKIVAEAVETLETEKIGQLEFGVAGTSGRGALELATLRRQRPSRRRTRRREPG